MKRYHYAVVAFLWICFVAISAHLLYSSFGFNPTDDGVTLAYSRRILEGQVPHRDFISIRPSLSPLLHLPEVLIGGAYTLWLSRFVFFLQLACIAWFGTRFISKGIGLPLSSIEQSALALISFAFCCHSFPAMAWTTTDGLFLCVLGLHFRARLSPYCAVIGYFLIGSAYLCKQSFFLVAPCALLLLGDWRKWKCVAASALPGILYIVYLLITGGLHDASQQLLSQSGIMNFGVRSYLNNTALLGVGVGFVASILFGGESNEGRRPRWNLRTVAGVTLIAVIFALSVKRLFDDKLHGWSFALFGLVCGALISLILVRSDGRIHKLQTGVVVALLAWSVSISRGYNYPVLGAGILLTFVFGLTYRQLPKTQLRGEAFALLVAALLTLVVFHHTRAYHIYRDWQASQLTHPLGDVLPGARHIRTNPNTYSFLADLNTAIRLVDTNKFKYAIVPQVAVHWVRARQANPLPIDWAQGGELNTPVLLGRELRAIERQRSQTVILVQKVNASMLSWGFYPIRTNDSWNAVVGYARTHLKKIGETKYFELYR